MIILRTCPAFKESPPKSKNEATTLLRREIGREEHEEDEEECEWDLIQFSPIHPNK